MSSRRRFIQTNILGLGLAFAGRTALPGNSMAYLAIDSCTDMLQMEYNILGSLPVDQLGSSESEPGA
jgi:hypothetical protein